MSRTILVCLLVAALTLCAYFAGTARLHDPIAVASQKQKDDPDFPVVREIELSAIYSTSDQKKLIDVHKHLEENSPERKAFKSIVDVLGEIRPRPRLAVVRGENIQEAMLATARFIELKQPPARPVGPGDKSTSKKCWLFVYITHDSPSGPQWLIYPTTQFGNKVRFTYTRFDGWFSPEPDEGMPLAAVDRAYLYWVPLGEAADPSALKAEMVEFSKSVRASYPPKAKK